MNENDLPEGEYLDGPDLLGDLLAVIHRDGGDYQGRHGRAAAVTEAHKVWASLIQRAEAAEAKVAKLREALAFYADRKTWKGKFPKRPIDRDCDGDFVSVSGLRARQALTETGDKDNE